MVAEYQYSIFKKYPTSYLKILNSFISLIEFGNREEKMKSEFSASFPSSQIKSEHSSQSNLSSQEEFSEFPQEKKHPISDMQKSEQLPKNESNFPGYSPNYSQEELKRAYDLLIQMKEFHSNLIDKQGFDIFSQSLDQRDKRDLPPKCLLSIKKYRALVYFFDGDSVYDVARRLHIHPGTISKWVKKFRETADIVKVKERSGRPSLLTSEMVEVIKRKLKAQPYSTQKDLSHEIKLKLGVKISNPAISRYLKKFGKYRKPQEVLVVSLENKQKRINFASSLLQDDLQNIVFSDETTFQLGKNKKKLFVLKGDKAPLTPQTFPVASVMVWGAISKKGKIAMSFIEDSFSKEKYISILSRCLPSADKVYGENKWRFQHDNSPCHTAYSVKEWIKENVHEVIDHPPQSPDLNPIELIWAIMKGYVSNSMPKSKDELCDAVHEAWDRISEETCFNCIEHTRKNLFKVIDNKGDFVR